MRSDLVIDSIFVLRGRLTVWSDWNVMRSRLGDAMKPLTEVSSSRSWAVNLFEGTDTIFKLRADVHSFAMHTYL